MTIRIKCNGVDITDYHTDHTPVRVECWWDRFHRNWVIYPVDAEGNQLEEARYGFNRAEAQQIKKDIEELISNGHKFSYYD